MDKAKVLNNLALIKDLIEECIQQLSSGSSSKRAAVAKKILIKVAQGVPRLKFDMPIRPFIKNSAKRMSGQKKFTLLTAYLAAGDVKKIVKLSEIERHWNKMTALLGGAFNRFYSQQAKDNDWVESKSKGTYNLRPNWVKIFES